MLAFFWESANFDTKNVSRKTRLQYLLKLGDPKSIPLITCSLF